MQQLKKSTVVTSFSKFPRFLSLSTACIQPTSISIQEANHVRDQQNQSFFHQNTSKRSSFKSPIVNGRVDLLHGQAIKTGKVQYCDVYNYLLSLYVKKHNLDDAGKLFEEIPVRDVYSWTILITGFALMKLPEKALGLFNEMQIEGVCPNHFTLSCVFKCCASVSDLGMGKKIHGWMLINGMGLDITLENSMVDFYVKCGDFDYAKRVYEMMAEKNTTSWNIIIGAYLAMGDMDTSIELFRRLSSKDVASWNTIIIGLIRHGCEKRALELLCEMCRARAVFNENTYSIALLLAASLSATEIGRQIHGCVFRMGYDQNKFIRNSTVNMYSKCGELDKASKILNEEPQKSENIHTSTSNCGLLESNISWSSIISGYVQSSRTEEAFELFQRMVCEAVELDPFTLTSIAAACADVGVSEWGKGIHTLIEKLGYINDDVLVSAMIDMYAKCGSLHDALSLFRQTNSRNIVLWTSMISGCALHGQGREAIRIFQIMLKRGIRPNEISFIGVLSGCSHAGLVEEGQVYFRSMREDYGIAPQVEHFTCMVDLFGRAGHFNEAKEFIYNNNVSHLSYVWKALLSACQIHKNFELGKWVSKQLHQIEPFNSESYVLLSNIYTTTHRWKEAAETRSIMQKRGFKKHPGQSWIRIKNEIHTFSVGDRSHPQAADIYSYLEKLTGKLKEIGYSSKTNLVMHDVEEEQREILLGFHSEKLAIAYGIMSTPSKTPILVMKNLRVCVDCHTAIKYISQITGREITVRDAHRFHHFSGGGCSCGDYW